MIFVTSGNSWFAEGQQNSSIRTELPDDMAGFHSGFGCNCDGLFSRAVSHPHVTLAVDMHAVGPDEHLSAEAFDDVSFGIEFVDRVVGFKSAIRIHAIDAETAASGDRQRTGLITSDKRPDAFTVGIDVHGGRRSHLSAAGKSRPLTSWNARATAIGQSPDGPIWIVSRALSERHHARREQHDDSPERNPPHSNRLRHGTPLFRMPPEC